MPSTDSAHQARADSVTRLSPKAFEPAARWGQDSAGEFRSIVIDVDLIEHLFYARDVPHGPFHGVPLPLRSDPTAENRRSPGNRNRDADDGTPFNRLSHCGF